MSSSKVLLYIVRHGESRGNVERAMIPQTEDNLTEKGRRQAIAAGTHLQGVHFTRAYASDYSRTLETAKLIIQQQAYSGALREEDIKQDKRLRERHLGSYEGLTYREALMDVIKSKVHINKHVIPKAETFDEINTRADSFLKEVLNEAFGSGIQNEAILVVSHALFINRVMLYLDPNEDQDQEQYEWRTVDGWEDKCQKIMANASYMVLEATRGDDAKVRLKFLKIHERSHLHAEDPDDHSGGTDLLRRFIEANPEGQYLSSCLQA